MTEMEKQHQDWVKQQVKCPECNGKGATQSYAGGYAIEKCENCNGTGTKPPEKLERISDEEIFSLIPRVYSPNEVTPLTVSKFERAVANLQLQADSIKYEALQAQLKDMERDAEAKIKELEAEIATLKTDIGMEKANGLTGEALLKNEIKELIEAYDRLYKTFG